MKKIINKIKLWFWWRFRANEIEKCEWDTITKGTGFMKVKKGLFKNLKYGIRIDPKKFYLP